MFRQSLPEEFRIQKRQCVNDTLIRKLACLLSGLLDYFVAIIRGIKHFFEESQLREGLGHAQLSPPP